MTGRSLTLLACAILSLQVQAASHLPDNWSQYCFYSLFDSLESLSWSGETSTGPGAQEASPECSNVLMQTSLYASCKTYCTPAQLEDGLEFWQGLCYQSKLDLSNITATATESYIGGLPIVDPDSNSTVTLMEPAVLSRSYYERAYASYKLRFDGSAQNKRFSWALLSYWGGIVLLGIFNNVFNILFHHRTTVRGADTEKAGAATSARRMLPGPLASFSFWIRTHIIVPATFGTYCQRKWFWCTVPQRSIFLPIFGFWCLCVILGAVGYSTVPGNTITPNVHQYLWNNVAVRCGYLAYSCIPWVWMFAQRNNIFIWATGWSFSTFNAFHRHCARATALFAIVHGVGYSVVESQYRHKYSEMLEVRWFQFGIVALVLMCLLVAFSSGFIRINYYESFLLIHICLSIVLVYALFVHSSVFEGTFNGYLWPLVAIWSFERLLRLIRVLYCNFHVRFSGSVFRTSSTTVTYDKASDVIRIDIQPASSLLKPAPGQYYHLYQPFALKGWENHPFSLGFYTTNPPPASLPPSPTTPTDLSKEIATATAIPTHSSSPPSLTSPPGPPTLTFYIRPYDGWTRRLRTACLAAPSHTLSPALLLEGPYGRPAPLHAFDTVVLLAGGTGIAAALPYVLDHAARAAAAPPRTRTVVLRLVWAVKRAGFVRALCAGELAGVLGRGGVEAEFYATAGEEAVVEGEEKGAGVAEAGVEIARGRPDVKGLVGAVARETEASGGRAVVFVCGPAAMADEARAAVHGEMKRGCRGIEYVEDCFGW